MPTIWQGIKSIYEADPEKYDLSKLTRLTCGGSAPPPSLIRWYADTLDVEMIQGWGMTETSPLVTLSRRVMKKSQLALSDDAQFENVAKQGQTAAVKIDAVTSVAFGRQFDHTYALYSRVTRTSIDALKEFFREELSKEDIDLLVKQKKQYGVI